MIDHPAAREETAHLNETLEIVAQQQLISAEELTVAKKNLQDTFRFERDNMDLLGVPHRILRMRILMMGVQAMMRVLKMAV